MPTSKLFALLSSHPYTQRKPTADELLVSREDLVKMAKEGKFTLTGRIVKDLEQRKRAIEFVEELKVIGREAGIELNEKNKN